MAIKKWANARKDNAYYYIPHDFDFLESCEKLSCPVKINPGNRYVPVLKENVQNLIKLAINTNSASIRVNCFFPAFEAGEDVFARYKNHLSDYDCYNLRGEVILDLSIEENKWKLEAKVSGNIVKLEF